VNKECDLGLLLQEYGYAVVPDRQREQQFSCDLHGVDAKPSARLYGATNLTHCWACQKTRDPIAYVMLKEYVGFVEAVNLLEKRLGLAPLPWDDEEYRPRDPVDELEGLATPKIGYKTERGRVCRFLDQLTQERDLDMSALLAFWEAFDRVDYAVARQGWPENKGAEAMAKIRERVMTRLRDAS
jgi:hypothetical protein